MKKHLRTCSLALLAVALGMPVFAQEKTGFDVQFRAKFGYGIEAKDKLPHRNLGLGLELGYTTSIGRFAAEVGSQYKSGNYYSYDWESAPKVQWYEENYDDYFWDAGDRRRNSLQGVTLRLTYEYSLSDEAIVRAGVQLSGARFRQEYLGVSQYLRRDWPGGALYTTDVITDSYAGALTNPAGLAPSPFIGVGYKFGSSTVEFNAIALAYKTINYVHVSGTGERTGIAWNANYNNSLDYTEERSRMVPHLEIAYAFRF